MIDKKNLYENMAGLIAAPSVSGTKDEVKAARKIEELLRQLPYFAEHPENVMMLPIDEDPFDRVIAAAYLECAPGNPNTIILTGHYDVVDVEEYGKLKDIAFDVEEITRRIGELALDTDARRDHESGQWYFGRGTADMKFGHALAIELLRHYAEEGLDGNLLYVAVCGEETNSEGMLAAVPFFNRFAKEKGLHYKALLLMEGYMVDGQKEGVNYIQYGGAGKVMPMFFCVGKMTHGEEPLLGLDANLLSAEVYRQMALNPVFCQQNHGITTAPPAGLKLQDLKENYSLSTALYAAAYFNVATIRLNPEETMEKMMKVAEDAFDETLALVERRVKEFETLTGKPSAHYKAEKCVMTFRQLYEEVEKTFDGDLSAHMKTCAAELMKKNPEMQDVSLKLVKHLYELYDDKKPMIIVSIIPPYYPDVNIEKEDQDTADLLRCIDDVITYARETYGETLETSEYYGISDLCYTWLARGMDFDQIFGNLVGSGWYYQFPAEEMKQFRVPAVVLGTKGKDMHKFTERLEKRFNFDVLPNLYTRLIKELLM